MRTSEQTNELSKALAAVQSEIESAKKTSNNPYFKSKYADLAEVWDTIRSALFKHGLSVIQAPAARFGEYMKRSVKTDNGYKEITEREAFIEVTTRLTHESGQWIEEVLTMLPVKSDPQALGSAITYARRYSLSAIVGVCQEDDDGAAASGTQGEKKTNEGNSKAEKNQPAWDLPKIQKIVSEAVREEVIKQGIKTPELISLFTLHNGDQDAILKAITK